MSESWIETGLDSPPEPREDSGQSGAFRFFLPKGGSAEIMFLSDVSQFYKVKQHEIWINGKPIFATCCQTDKRACPLCEAAKVNEKMKRREWWIGTVLNLSGYQKDGQTKGQYKRQLFCMNYSVKNMMEAHFEAIIEQGKSIRGAVFKMKRTNGEKSFKTGDVPMYTRHGDLEKAKASGYEIEPFNLLDLPEFKPDYELCRKLAMGAGATVGGAPQSEQSFAGGQNFAPSTDDEAPF